MNDDDSIVLASSINYLHVLIIRAGFVTLSIINMEARNFARLLESIPKPDVFT
jgi:hypothetical protein